MYTHVNKNLYTYTCEKCSYEGIKLFHSDLQPSISLRDDLLLCINSLVNM